MMRKKLTDKQIKEALELHKKWLEKKPKGIRADFSECDFTNKNLENADLTKTILSGCIFKNTNLKKAKLDYAQADLCSFFDTKMENCSFKHTKLHISKFKNCEAAGSNFSCSELPTCEFISTNLQDCSFKKASTHQTRFENCDLTNAKLEDANPVTALFKDSVLPEGFYSVNSGKEIVYDAKNDHIYTGTYNNYKGNKLEDYEKDVKKHYETFSEDFQNIEAYQREKAMIELFKEIRKNYI